MDKMHKYQIKAYYTMRCYWLHQHAMQIDNKFLFMYIALVEKS